MGAINAIAGGASARASGFSGLSSDEFMRIVLEELGQQDPLEPSDTGALLDQLASIRAIQADVDLEKSLDNLVTRNELSSATGLIGRIVAGTSESGEPAADLVVSVLSTRDGPVLNLASGQRVRMDGVSEVLSSDIVGLLGEDTGEDEEAQP